MATNEELRPSNRPAHAGRLPVRALVVAVLAALLGAAFLAGAALRRETPQVEFLQQALGAPAADGAADPHARRGHGRRAPPRRLLPRPRIRLGRPPLDRFGLRQPRSPRQRRFAPHRVRLGGRHGDAGEDRAVPDGRRAAGSEDLALAARKSQPDPEGWRRRCGRLHPQRSAHVGRRVHRAGPAARRPRATTSPPPGSAGPSPSATAAGGSSSTSTTRSFRSPM